MSRRGNHGRGGPPVPDDPSIISYGRSRSISPSLRRRAGSHSGDRERRRHFEVLPFAGMPSPSPGDQPICNLPEGPGRGPCRGQPAGGSTDSSKPIVEKSKVPLTPEAIEKQIQKSLHVTQTELNAATNGKAHHTEKYEIVEDGRLVIRRGQSFDIKLTMNRPYKANKDEMRIVFEIGSKPTPGKGSSVRLPLTGATTSTSWRVQVDQQQDSDLHLNIFVPAKCIIGKWKFYTLSKEEDTDNWLKAQPETCYILFNPWCKEDFTYMKDAHLLEEYVLNDSGCIYTGSSRWINAKPWAFGQFEDGILEAALCILDKGFNEEYTPARGDPVRVSRIISKLVNNNDDGGVLHGNWSGQYRGGIPPTFWTGSFSILDEYMRGQHSVKYGQCWVYSGVTTTVCRAIGLPSRSVTNFKSAHDTDGNITIDTYYLNGIHPINSMNNDSIWNFHVWNEAWMTRPDLQNKYDGWQVIDATPQEGSDGVFCCGPAPVAAIKAGDVSISYDAPFIFAEVNSDKLHWSIDENGDSIVMRIEKDVTGKFISTKVPDGKPLEDGKAQRLDITDTYKHPEGHAQEREAVIRAAMNLTTEIPYGSQFDNSIKAEFIVKEEKMVGEDFHISIRLSNNFAKDVTVDYLRVQCDAMFYIGVVAGEVKTNQYKDFKVKAMETVTLTMNVTKEEYLPHLAELNDLRFRAVGFVKQTDEYFQCEEDIHLIVPSLQLEMPKTTKVKVPFMCKISLTNPLPVPLTNGILSVEGPGMEKAKIAKVQKIEAGATWTTKIEMTPKREGKKQVLASFDCDELPDANGSGVITVEPAVNTQR